MELKISKEHATRTSHFHIFCKFDQRLFFTIQTSAHEKEWGFQSSNILNSIVSKFVCSFLFEVNDNFCWLFFLTPTTKIKYNNLAILVRFVEKWGQNKLGKKFFLRISGCHILHGISQYGIFYLNKDLSILDFLFSCQKWTVHFGP